MIDTGWVAAAGRGRVNQSVAVFTREVGAFTLEVEQFARGCVRAILLGSAYVEQSVWGDCRGPERTDVTDVLAAQQACESAARAAGIAVPDAAIASAIADLPVLARPFSGEERAALEGAVRPLIYMAAPVAPTAEQIDALVACFLGAPTADDPPAGIVAARAIATSRIIDENLRRARRWLRWFAINAPHLLVIAPWIAQIQSSQEAGEEESVARPREMAVCRDVASRCYAVVQVGGRVSSGMAEEGKAAPRVIDLTSLGEEPPREGEDTAWALAVLADALEEVR